MNAFMLMKMLHVSEIKGELISRNFCEGQIRSQLFVRGSAHMQW